MAKDFPMYGHVLIGFVSSALFFILNYYSIKTSGVVQTITTGLKFIPLLIAIVVGIIMATTHNKGGHDAFRIITDSKTGANNFTFKGLIIAIPATLFAYDAFLLVAQISPKVKGGERRTAYIVLVGMIIVVGIYTLIAISSILHNQGIVGFLLEDSLNPNLSKTINVIVYLFLFISAYGVLNGLSLATVAMHEQIAEMETLIGQKKLNAKFGSRITALIYGFISMGVITLCYGLPAIIGNSDSYVDGITNMPVIFFFAIYAVTILLYTIKRKKFETKKISPYLFKPAA
jgi:amino acid transporter